MSQHHFYTICRDIRQKEKDAVTHVMIAWDRKLEQYSMVIYQNHYLNPPIFSICDVNKIDKKTLESCLHQLRYIGIYFPIQMTYELYQDAVHRIGKKQVIHINKNGKYKRHEGTRPIMNLKIAHLFYSSDVFNPSSMKNKCPSWLFKLINIKRFSISLMVLKKVISKCSFFEKILSI